MPISASSFKPKDLLRILLGILLLTALLMWVDLSETWEILRQISWSWIGILFAISFVLIGLSCAKWRLFLQNRGIEPSLMRLMGLYVIGYFFNNFTLGNVGGDVVRGAMMGRQSGKHSDSFGSVFMERFTGFLALFLMALLGAAARPDLLADPRLLLAMGLIAVLFLGIVVSMACPPVQRIIRSLLGRGDSWSALRKLQAFAEVLFDYHQHTGLLIKAMAWSLLFQVMTVVNAQAACLALGIEADFLELMVLVPMVLLVAAVPVSINGWGFMEGGFVLFLGMAGIAEPEALSIALVLRGKNLVLAALGGVLMVLWKPGQLSQIQPETESTCKP